MQSSKYLEQNNLDIWHFRYTRNKHKQNLSEIANRSSIIDKNRPSCVRRKFRETICYRNQEKEREIKRENDALLDRLLRISQRSLLNKTVARTSLDRSLNLNHRKKEARRIHLENRKFANRLLEKKSSISLLHIHQFGHNSKLTKLSSKLPLIEKRGKAVDLSPPKHFKTHDSSAKLLTHQSSTVIGEESPFLAEFRNRKKEFFDTLTKPLENYREIELMNVTPTQEFTIPHKIKI